MQKYSDRRLAHLSGIAHIGYVAVAAMVLVLRILHSNLLARADLLYIHHIDPDVYDQARRTIHKPAGTDYSASPLAICSTRSPLITVSDQASMARTVASLYRTMALLRVVLIDTLSKTLTRTCQFTALCMDSDEEI